MPSTFSIEKSECVGAILGLSFILEDVEVLLVDEDEVLGGEVLGGEVQGGKLHVTGFEVKPPRSLAAGRFCWWSNLRFFD